MSADGSSPTSQELTRRIQALERSNEDLRQFAYVASHDLQEPLRSIHALVDVALHAEREALGPRACALLEEVLAHGERMAAMIQDLLAYARVERTEARMLPLPLDAVVQEVVGMLAAQTDESGAEIEVGDLPVVRGDLGQLRQLFLNLLGNALKFRGEAPCRIVVSPWQDADEQGVCVADNGIGFPAEKADRIFAMFQRLHPRHRYAGSGIGLAICRKVVDHHEGRIWAESTPGAGSRFYVAFPVDEDMRDKR